VKGHKEMPQLVVALRARDQQAQPGASRRMSRRMKLTPTSKTSQRF